MSVAYVAQVVAEMRSAMALDDVLGGGLIGAVGCCCCWRSRVGLWTGWWCCCCCWWWWCSGCWWWKGATSVVDDVEPLSIRTSVKFDFISISSFSNSQATELALSASFISLFISIVLDNVRDFAEGSVACGVTLVPFFIVHWLAFAKTSAVVRVGLSSFAVADLGDGGWTKLTGRSMTRSGVCLNSVQLLFIRAVSSSMWCWRPRDLMPDMTSASALSMSWARSSGVLFSSSIRLLVLHFSRIGAAAVPGASDISTTSSGIHSEPISSSYLEDEEELAELSGRAIDWAPSETFGWEAESSVNSASLSLTTKWLGGFEGRDSEDLRFSSSLCFPPSQSSFSPLYTHTHTHNNISNNNKCINKGRTAKTEWFCKHRIDGITSVFH